jgi:hypothetical protein
MHFLSFRLASNQSLVRIAALTAHLIVIWSFCGTVAGLPLRRPSFVLADIPRAVVHPISFHCVF